VTLASARTAADGPGVSLAPRIAVYAVIVVCLIVVVRQAAPPPPAVSKASDGGAQYRLDRVAADRAHVALLSTGQRAMTFGFAPGTDPQHQRIFLAAIAAARPEAQRLVALVDGLVTVRFGDPPGPPIGLTHFDGVDYDVTIGVSEVIGRFGRREANAIVLHELGHVVDIALVPDELRRELDAGIPTGESCRSDSPPTGACAPIEERFADSFSKWAMDDLGVNLASGYRILAPVPLKAWGRPLAELGAEPATS